MLKVWAQLRELLDMIKFEHTLFALPFAFIAALEAARGIPPVWRILWILLAMVGARTAAMTFNRLVDEDLDAENPRTQNRALPAGRVSRHAAMVLLGLSVLVFSFSAGMLGPLPWKLTPLALCIILGYSLCKRFTSFSHLVLGLALACAPIGAWIAVGGSLSQELWFLALGVLMWTAGFDVLYALQDLEFDRIKRLGSIPAMLGVSGALWFSRLSHAAALLAWANYNRMVQSHLFPWMAWLVVAIILVREQWIMRRGELRNLDHAFFTLNSLVGPLLFFGHCAEWFISRGPL